MSDLSELERRLAALRAPKPSSKPSPVPTPSSPPPASTLLETLDPPTSFTPPHPHIETKNVSDEEVRSLPLSLPLLSSLTPGHLQVERYLSSFSSPPSSLPISTSPRLNRALDTYESLLPALGPIEVTFAPRVGDGPGRSEDEDEALMARLRDELTLEKAHGDGSEGWEKRMEGLRGVVVGGTTGGGGTGEEGGMGEAPRAVDVGDFRDESDDESGSEKSEESERDSEEED